MYNEKSWNKNRKGFTISKLHTLFIEREKLLEKPTIKYFIVFLLKLVLSKASLKQRTKVALALVLGKSTFNCMTFRMDTQLHMQANHGI